MKILKYASLSFLILLQTPTYAQEARSEGTRGGGEVVRVNNRYELRDLLEKTNCEWLSGGDVFSQTTYLKPLLNNLAKLEPYFALHLQKEIEGLPFCFTRDLIQVNTKDSDSVNASYYSERTSQIAIRLDREVYIDHALFKQLPKKSQALLIVHEAMHSFLAPNEGQRNQRLRSFVNTIAQVDAGVIKTLDKLYVQMENDRIQFPRVMNVFTSDEIIFLVGNKEQQRNRVLALPQKELSLIFQKIPTLPYGSLLEFNVNLPSMMNILLDACKEEDLAVIKKMFSFTGLPFNPAFVCMASNDIFENQVVLKYLMESSHLQQGISGVYSRLSAAEAIISQYRIQTTELKLLAASSNDSFELRPIMHYRPIKNGELNFNPEMKGILNLIISMARNDAWDFLDESFFSNKEAKVAFSLSHLYQTLSAVGEYNEGENASAKKNLENIHKGFFKAAAIYFASELSPELANKVISKFNQLNPYEN